MFVLKVNSKDTRRNISVPLTMNMSTNLHKKTERWKKKNAPKNNSWQDFGPRSAGESKCSIRSSEIPSPRQTSIDKTNECVMKNLNGARSLGAPTHPLVTVFTTLPAIGGGRRPGVCYQNSWRVVCTKQTTKIVDPLRWQKTVFFFRFGRRA